MFSRTRRPRDLETRLQHVERGVRTLLETAHLPPTPGFRDLVRKELALVPSVDLSIETITHDEINRLYELRAQLLDWETETGFLGFFHDRRGIQYIYRRRLEVLFDMLPPLHGTRVLEIGCAAGILGALLAPETREYVGIDVTPTAVAFARQLSRTLHCFQARFFEGDAHTLDFPDFSFDVIVSMEVLEHLIHPEAALAEFHRVLKPGGSLVLTTTTAVSPSDAAVKLIRLVRPDFYVDTERQFDKKAYLAAQAKGVKADPRVFRRVHHRFGYRQLTRLFKEKGFHVERARGAVFAFPPVYLAVYRFLPAFVLPFVRELEALLNELEIFKRFGSVTTGFLLRRI